MLQCHYLHYSVKHLIYRHPSQSSSPDRSLTSTFTLEVCVCVCVSKLCEGERDVFPLLLATTSSNFSSRPETEGCVWVCESEGECACMCGSEDNKDVFPVPPAASPAWSRGSYPSSLSHHDQSFQLLSNYFFVYKSYHFLLDWTVVPRLPPVHKSNGILSLLSWPYFWLCSVHLFLSCQVSFKISLLACFNPSHLQVHLPTKSLAGSKKTGHAVKW